MIVGALPHALGRTLSLLRQGIPPIASTSEQFAFAKEQLTCGQRCHTITREVVLSVFSPVQRFFAGGYSCTSVTKALAPAEFPAHLTDRIATGGQH